MAKAWWIFNEDGEKVAGPYTNRDAAAFDLRVARTYKEVDESAFIDKADVTEDDWR